MAIWPMQHAKAHLSKVINDAQTNGPQFISEQGVERYVVLSIAEYRKLTEPEGN